MKRLPNKERLDIESKIISSMLNSESAFIDLLSFGIDSSLFRSNKCKSVFNEAVKYFHNTSNIPNNVSLFESLMGQQNEVKNYLGEYNTMNLRYMEYAKVLLEDNCQIQIESIFQGIENNPQQGIDLAFDLNEKLNGFIYDYYKKYDSESGNHSIAQSVLKNVEDIMSGKNSDYIPSGFKDLDKKIIGFHKKSITVIAARPGMGKTSFLLQLKRNFNSQGKKVGIISIEMDNESLWVRDLSALTKIDSMRIDTGQLKPNEFQMLKKEAEKLVLTDFVIDDSPFQTVNKVINLVNKWKMQNKVDVVFLDYLTLLKGEQKEKFSRYDLEIGNMTEKFRQFAKETETPIIILSQLNREAEKRIDKRPQLSDLRESGSIEQDARTVIFLYRPAYYGINPFEEKKDSNDYYTVEKQLITAEEFLEVIVAKNRGGLVGRVPLRYIRSIHTFENLYNITEIV